jgi:hypothetical protein
VHPEEILMLFSKTEPVNTYEAFIAETDEHMLISPLLIDDGENIPA